MQLLSSGTQTISDQWPLPPWAWPSCTCPTAATVQSAGRGEGGKEGILLPFPSGTAQKLHLSLCVHLISPNLVSWPHLSQRQGREMCPHVNPYPAKSQRLSTVEGGQKKYGALWQQTWQIWSPPPTPASPLSPSLWPAALPASFLGVFECPQLEPLIILRLTPPPPLGP